MSAIVTSHSPEPVEVGQLLVIRGQNLDSCTQVVFRSRGGSGVTNARPQSVSATEVTVIVPLRSKSGNFYLITRNSGNVVAPGMITITDPFAPPPTPPPGPGGAPGGAPVPPGGAPAGGGGGFGGAARTAWSKFGGVASVAAIVGATASAGHAGGGIAKEFVSGATAIPRATVDVGGKIALTILDSMLSVLGPSGSALSSFAGKVWSAIGSALDGGVKLLGSGAKALGGIAGAGLAGIGALGGAAVGALGAVGNVATSLLGGGQGGKGGDGIFRPVLEGAAIGAGLVAGILHAFEGLAKSIEGILQSVAKGFSVAGELAASTIKTLADVLSDSFKTTLDRAQSILSLSQSSGWDLTQSADAVQVGAAFGISASSLPRGNAMLSGAMGGLYGGDGSGSAADIRAYRSAYRGFADSGPVGLLMAQNLEGATGKSAYRAAVNLDDKTFNQQLQVQQGLALDPATTKAVGQDLKSSVDTLGMLSSAIKEKFLSAFLPVFQRGLDVGVKYWSEHKDSIVKAVVGAGKSIVHFALKTLPTALLSGFDIVRKAGSSFLHWIAGVGRSFSSMLKAFDSGAGPLFNIARAIATVVDLTIAGLNGLLNAFIFVGNAVSELAALISGDAWGDINGGFAYDVIPQTDTVGMVEDMANSGAGKKAAKGVDAAADAVDKTAGKFDDWGDKFSNRLHGWVDAGESGANEIEKLLNPLEAIQSAQERATQIAEEQWADIKKRTQGMSSKAVGDLLTHISEALVEDSYLQGRR